MTISFAASILSLVGVAVVAVFGYLSTRSSKAAESKDKREERLDRGVQEMIDDYRDEITRLVQKITRLEERTERLEGINDAQRETIRGQAGTIAEHEITIKSLIGDNARLTGRVSELEKTNASC